MNKCVICGAPTENKVACQKHTRVNTQWKSYNSIRKTRGLPPMTWPEYEARLEEFFSCNQKKPSFFAPEDMDGPTVEWDGTDRSPCTQGCAHRLKNKDRFGCVTCGERWKFWRACSIETIQITIIRGMEVDKSLDFAPLAAR